MGWDQIGRDNGGNQFGTFGDDLKDIVGLILGGKDIAEFIEAEDFDGGIIIEEIVFMGGFFEFFDEIKAADAGGRDAMTGDQVITQAVGEMGFSDTGRADEDDIGGMSDPVTGGEEGQNFIFGDFGIKGPVKIFDAFNAFDAGALHKIADAFEFAGLQFFVKNGFEDLLLV